MMYVSSHPMYLWMLHKTDVSSCRDDVWQPNIKLTHTGCNRPPSTALRIRHKISSQSVLSLARSDRIIAAHAQYCTSAAAPSIPNCCRCSYGGVILGWVRFHEYWTRIPHTYPRTTRRVHMCSKWNVGRARIAQLLLAARRSRAPFVGAPTNTSHQFVLTSSGQKRPRVRTRQ